MQRYEFKVVPAPRRGEKARGIKTSEERFAYALSQVMNALGAEGWDYVRADALPCDERAGLTGTKTIYQNMLVFRRPLAEASAALLSAAPAANAAPAFAAMRPLDEPVTAAKLGAAEPPLGSAPSLGAAKHELAAE